MHNWHHIESCMSTWGRTEHRGKLHVLILNINGERIVHEPHQLGCKPEIGDCVITGRTKASIPEPAAVC